MNELDKVNEIMLRPSALPSVDSVRAVEEVRAAITVAKKFPRNELDAQVAILNACRRLSLAEVSMYAYSRGGTAIRGASIHLAKAVAQKWGNLQYGIREIERRPGESTVEAYCWDMENNTRPSIVFTVPHEMKLKTGAIKKLDDPRDIYELISNNGARRLRKCIMDCIPKDIMDAAFKQCKETLEKGDGMPLKDRIARMIQAFQEIGVTKEMIEKRVQHNAESIIAAEVITLLNIFTSIRDGMSKREDWFDLSEVNTEEKNKADDLNEKLLADSKTKIKN